MTMKTVAGISMGVVLLLWLTACGGTNANNAALTFPHVAGTVWPLKLVIFPDGPALQYLVECTGAGQFKLVQVDFHVANSAIGAGRAMAQPGGPGQQAPLFQTCTAGEIVVEGESPPIAAMRVGERITISFSVTLPNGSVQKVHRAYVKGEDGALH